MMLDRIAKRGWVRPALLLLGLAAGAVALRAVGARQLLSIENLGRLRAAVEELGAAGPVIYILLYVAATVFFLPGLPVTLLAGVFGALPGTVYASVGSTVGASLAFLIARYALRPTVERWVEGTPAFRRIDEGVRAHGWRMVMITRLVPIFPFNLQNYAYGLTSIPFGIYVVVSGICMLPGTVAFVFAGGSLVSGEGRLTTTLAYLSVAAVALVLLSLLPGFIRRRYPLADAGEARRGRDHEDAR